MSNPIDNFEFILKKQCEKRPFGLYSDNKQQNKHTYKPQDVISSVSLQLKAINQADSLNSVKFIDKNLQKLNKCNFLSVSKLPLYEEVPKQTTKFDTQCVSDTQLINVIEDAEIMDVQRGMTQEFETTFSRHTEQYNTEEEENTIKAHNSEKIKNSMDKIHKNITEDIIETKSDSILNNNKEYNYINTDKDIGPITCSNVRNNEIGFDPEVEKISQILNESTQSEDEDLVIERPLSPIFMHKKVKLKSKNPSPLVFSLDKFEQFENIAIPIVAANDLETAKHVINSQILDKELHINIDEEILLNDRDILSPVLQNKNLQGNETEIKSYVVKDPDSDTDLEFIEFDKLTSDDLVNKIMNDKREGHVNAIAGSVILKDEILFSSDEEDSYVHKDYQDLPFTCALETSFYDKSDVLDKTMFVGFQTASNKSIQILTESFAHAKNLLHGVTSDEITVTDLVKSCDSYVKNKTQVGNADQVKYDSVNVEKEFKLAERDDKETELLLTMRNTVEKDIISNDNVIKPDEKINFEGFMTASNKVIRLSDKALSRCRKVFQDIDINENFDNQNERDNAPTKDEFCDHKIPIATENSESNLIKTFADDDAEQNIDDVIMQEFENIEMSLEENNETGKNVASIGFKTASNKNIKILDVALDKIKDVFKDIDFDEDLNQFETRETTNVNAQIKMIEDPQLSKNTGDRNFKGFKTASNKNIAISTEVLAKTKNLFQNLDSIEFPKKSRSIKSSDKIDKEFIDFDVPLTNNAEFVGFKTANNKNIKISNQALGKTKDIFKDIDSIDFELPKKKVKDFKNDACAPNQPSSNMTSFEGNKTANNKNICITNEAAKSKDVFENINSADFKLLNNNNNVLQEAKLCEEIERFIDFNKPFARKTSFGGFKTANNRVIEVSDAAMEKTKKVFKDIDSADFGVEKYSIELGKVEDGKPIKKLKIDEADTVDFYNQPFAATSGFVGFKTANNKEIKISATALAKTKNIFDNIDSDEMGFLKKVDKDSEEQTEGRIRANYAIKNTYNMEMKDLNNPSTIKASFGGFKTAGNKNIKVTKQALAKTKDIFKDIDATDFKFPEKANKGLAGSDLKERKNEEMLQSINESEMLDLNRPSTSKTSLVGFKTDNNRKISISEESLAKTRNIFKDIESKNNKLPKNPVNNLDEVIKEKSACPELKDFKQFPQSESHFVGFKTANNKVINISETALAKTKNLFNHIETTEFQLTETFKEDYPDIGEESNQLTRDVHGSHVIGKDNSITENKLTVPTFQGFQTASNKQVKISADALLKSRKIFQEDLNIDRLDNKDVLHTAILDTIDEPSRINKEMDDVSMRSKSSPIFKGFQTGNKKPVTVSKEALAKSKNLFKDLEIIPNNDDFEPEFYGFKMANDEKVVSDKKLFDDRKSFKGFHSASDKKVIISEDSLTKCRKVFQGLDSTDKFDRNADKTPTNINFEFKTGTNRDIVISEEAIARSKRLFSDIDDSNEYHKNVKKDEICIEDNIDNIIDTQVLNNFEESLYTEDFRDTSIKSKRSGSPILSCPKAKKRKKFETPYSQKATIKPVLKNQIINKNVNKITFNENYKKNKQYSLKDLTKLIQSKNTAIDPYLLQFNFDNLLEFKFPEHRNGLSYDNMTLELLKELFLNSVNSKLVPNGWLDNHLKLILWKLISYEVVLKSSVVCSARNVVDQLKYRYDKELYNAQRPALRKILEKDDVASKTVVLCVAGIYVDDVSVASATNTNNLELLLTDGWYCVRANIDKMLAQLVCAGKICIGAKIVTNGAELVGCEQGISPWEDTSAVRLKIFGNSTRRARWDARLGYHSNGTNLTQLSSVRLDGGKVSKLRLFVTRVYPALYVEKFEDGSTVTRSERLEHLHQMKSEAERQAIMEKIYEEVEKEFSDQESQDSEGLSDSSNKRTSLDSGSQIAKVMKRSKDPAEFRADLTSSQSRLLEAHTSKRREHLLQDIQKRIRDKVEKAGVCVNRNVVTLLKIRVAGLTERNGVEVTKGMMSIWKPNDAILEIIKEGTWIDVMNVVPTAVRYSEIQISAGRQSVFSSSKYKEPEKFKPYTKLLKRNSYTIKELSQNPSMSSDYNEIDTVGFIFLIDPTVEEFESTKQPFQNLFLADSDKNMICINFWGGLKKFGFQNVLDTGQVVACVNLQKRAGNTRKSILQYRVTDFTYFTKTPKNENSRNLLDGLNKTFISLDRRKFCEDCVILKNNYSVIKLNNENISPYRFNNSDLNMSKNKIFIDSPLARLNKIDDNFNLTGLDFESTFKQTDTQLREEVLLRKKKVNEKIAMLKMYGEPPPLSTIYILNKSKNASSSYKSPLMTNNNNVKNISHKSESENVKALHSKSDSSVNVASVAETPGRCANLTESDITCSPIFLNRTYVKSVNPVKINFDMTDNNDSNVDNFAEEFDGSPPLSLD